MRSELFAPKPFVTGDSADPALDLAREILTGLFGPPHSRTFAVRLWDGSTDSPETTPRFTLILRRRGALRRMLLPATERRLGEAYIRDDLDVEGDFEAAASLVVGLADRVPQLGLPFRLSLLRVLTIRDDEAGRDASRQAYAHTSARHSRHRDAAAIRYHYDLGNDFYRLWLDRRMVYSCAYFSDDTEDLDRAQEAKLELICRKLRLRPGERLLDIGCGWGALLLYAAEHYDVRATGVTLSRQQAALARERIAEAGLTGRCDVQLCDYRDLPATEFDKIASVGMVEHVGRAMLPTYFRHVFRRLAPGGLFLNHGIVTLTSSASALKRWLAERRRRRSSFIDAYVFPDGELVSPEGVLAPATRAGFEVRDVENLREHYATTLRHWVHRLEAHHDEAVALIGEETYRVWRVYMAGSAQAFASGKIGVIQALLARRDRTGLVRLPLTRADLYPLTSGIT